MVDNLSSNPNGLLRVFCVSCSNVPNPERFGVVDPYVNLTFQGVWNIPKRFIKPDPFVAITYQGIKKRTNYKKSELNPIWNEKLEFDLKGTPIATNDVIDVELKDYENIGANKLLARGTVPLAQLISHGSLKYQVELTDTENNKLESTKLLLNLEYKCPTVPSNNPKAAPIAGGDVSTLDLTPSLNTGVPGIDINDPESMKFKRREAKERSTKLQDFQIRIKVFQARQLDGNNIHPMTRIKCANQQKHTKTMRSTNSPYWDEVFFFNFNSSQADLFDQMIEFQVYNALSYLKDALIGSFKMDIGYVYDEPFHSLINKWLLLGDTEDCMSGAKGYLKVTINVLGPGDEVPPNPDPSIEDDMETNLLKPAGMMLRPATFLIKVYRAEDIPRMDSTIFQGVKSIFSVQDQKKEFVDPYVVFSFAGKKVQTKIIYNNASPVWNQELKMGLKFPSMCDKLTIMVKDWDRTSADDIVSRFYLKLDEISNYSSVPAGFLPTFGPCYLNMYGAPREYSELPTNLDELNLGRGEGVAYRGRLLFEVQTILGELPTEALSDIKSAELARVEPHMRRNNYKLHAAFLDATMISEIEKPIEFEVSIGVYGNKLDENVSPSSSTTPPCNAVFDGCSYYFLPWGDIKPCMQILSKWEDISYRIEAINQIKRLKQFVESCIAGIKSRIESMGDNLNVNSPEMSQLAVQILKNIETIKYKASIPLPEAINGKHQPNELDKLLRKQRMKYLKQIVSKCDKLPNMEFKSVLEELQEIYDILDQIQKEPQNSIPDVIIWMLCGNERTAYFRIPASEIMYSSKPECKGELCSKLQTITLKWPGKEAEDRVKKDIIPAQIRVKLWLGLERDEKDWLLTHIDESLNGAVSIYAEAYENQTYAWTSRKWTAEGLSRPPFSDSTGKVALPKDKFKLPQGWEWKGDWEIAPEVSLLFDKDAGYVHFMEEVYEQWFRIIPGASWSEAHGDRKPYKWADFRCEKTTSKDDIELADNWKWDDEWTVDINRAVDSEGWEYCVEPSMGGWSPSEKLYHLNRRRRWIRNRSYTAAAESAAIKSPTTQRLIDALKEGWEYSKLFSTKFHAKEQTTDTVRRRRWHRPMQPHDKTADMNAVFRFENDDEMVQNEVINLNAPRMFIKFKSAYKYQLRAYIYQARSLLAGDTDTSLSDPYAQVSFLTQSAKTEIVKKSLSPTWDQTLIFENVEIHGNPADIMSNPPQVLVEIFDHDNYFFDIGIGDNTGKPDFLGRCSISPIVRSESNYGRPAKLEWISLKKHKENAGEMLVCLELFLLDEKNNNKYLPSYPPKVGALYRVPSGIRPELQRTMIEILSWGVRNMKTFQLSDVECPQVIFECGGQKVESEVIKNVKQNPNFSKPVLYFDIMIPKEEMYIPPMNINVLDHRHFGRKPIVGVHVIKSLSKFRVNRELEQNVFSNIEAIQSLDHTAINMDGSDSETELMRPGKKKMKNLFRYRERRESKFKRINKAFGNYNAVDLAFVEEDIDWWCKFFASLGEVKKCGSYLTKGYEKITIFNDELEKQKRFDCFTDFCETFALCRGKTINEEEYEIVGEFKGMFKIYPIPEDTLSVADNMIFKNIQPMHKEECILRVYIVRGIDLQSKDSNGKSDPYIQIEVGKTKIDSRDNYIPNSTNPEFGRMFELKVVLPLQKDLCIRVKDYDLISSDEIIGETWIDLENRLLTKHRATCGIPIVYNESGPNRWRDSKKPSQILSDVCKLRGLHFVAPKPGETTLVVDKTVFSLDRYEKAHKRGPHLGRKDERLCLYVLKEFNLVPEHVETRKLYNPIQPGVEQGRLQMWVDIFPRSLGNPGPAFDISPRKAKKYQLRCIVWNTSEVPCDDISITGEKMSDIYVTGWLQGLEEQKQKTDIHYRSMDGDGNFNWRYVFDFSYLPAEQTMVVKKKEHFWSLDETETKMPPCLTIQIWDNDKFSADDFLGQLSLNLNSMIRPAKDSDKCGLQQLPDNFDGMSSDHKSLLSGGAIGDHKFVSLFEQRRLKGWWPCIVELPDNRREIAGKVELELEILNEEEANERPAGRGFEEPNQNPRLEPPVRPETSFLWFTSPLKSFKHILWKRYKWWFITAIVLLFFVIFLALCFYTLPGAMWNIILNKK